MLSLIFGPTPQEYIRKRRLAYPSQYQSDTGWAALIGGALTCVPPDLQNYADGHIASAEIGELSPAVRSRVCRGGYAIEMYSGYMRLVYSAARALCATDSIVYPGQQVPSLLRPDRVVAIVAELFNQYKANDTATAQAFPVTEAQANQAHIIATEAERFILLHELAHIDFWRNGQDDLSADESIVDARAAGWLIDNMLSETPSTPPQMMYGGAEFALRVWMAMERYGIAFEGTHPSGHDRIEALRAQLKERAAPAGFFAIAGRALAFDLLWQRVDQLLQEQEPVYEQTADLVLSQMRTLVIEIVNHLKKWDAEKGTYVIPLKLTPIPGEPGKAQVTLGDVPPEVAQITVSAKHYLDTVDPAVREQAKERAGELYEQGDIRYSLLLMLLNVP